MHDVLVVAPDATSSQLIDTVLLLEAGSGMSDETTNDAVAFCVTATKAVKETANATSSPDPNESAVQVMVWLMSVQFSGGSGDPCPDDKPLKAE